MPTTIYDASQITKRTRDKIIAQQIQQRNSTGNPIISPQAGYASYVIEEKDNGSITDFRKRGECTNINPSCSCFGNNNSTIILANDNIVFTHNILTNNTIVEIEIIGSGTINWGDDTIESFNTSEILVLSHSYVLSGTYTVTINGNIFDLTLTNLSNAGGLYYPELITITFNEINNLESLTLYTDTLTSITNFSLLKNTIKDIFIGDNNVINYSEVLTFTKLTSLSIADTTAMPSMFDMSILTELRYLYLEQLNITNIIIPDGLLYLSCPGCITLSTLPTLPSGLISLNIGDTGINSLPTLPSGLTDLVIYNTSINSLPTLPSGLTNLDIGATNINSLPTLPSGLTNLVISSTSINSLPTLPSGLTSLNIAYTNINSLPTLPSGLTNLVISGTSINSLPTLPTGLTYLDIGETSINFLPTLPAGLTTLITTNCILLSNIPNIPVPLLDIQCAYNNINQINANIIVNSLVSNGILNGTLVIETQISTTLDITGGAGGNWMALISNGWTIT